MRIVLCILCLLCASINASAQVLLWEVVEDLSGGTDIAHAIALTNRSVVVIGNASKSSAGVDDFVIQSLRRSDGRVRWTARVPEAPNQLLPLQITSHQGRLFAAGYAAGATPSSTDIVVRAYDALSGSLLWNNVWDAGQDDVPQAIAAGPSAVIVVGYGGDSAGHATNFLVRAYDPLTGDVLWEDRIDRADLDTAAWSVVFANNRVFVAGTTTISNVHDLFVRAYKPSSGALVWELTRAATSPVAIAASAGRVFVAGASANRNYIGAFDAKSGGLLWEDTDASPGSFRDLAVDRQQLVAVGSSQLALLVRAYDPATGDIRWEDRTSGLPGFREFAATVAINDRAVYVGGSSGQDFVSSDMLVRAYDASCGALLWDDRSNRSTDTAVAAAVSLGKNRLFVAGYAFRATTDFVIRAYDIRHDAADSTP